MKVSEIGSNLDTHLMEMNLLQKQATRLLEDAVSRSYEGTRGGMEMRK